MAAVGGEGDEGDECGSGRQRAAADRQQAPALAPAQRVRPTARVAVVTAAAARVAVVAGGRRAADRPPVSICCSNGERRKCAAENYNNIHIHTPV